LYATSTKAYINLQKQLSTKFDILKKLENKHLNLMKTATERKCQTTWCKCMYNI